MQLRLDEVLESGEFGVVGDGSWVVDAGGDEDVVLGLVGEERRAGLAAGDRGGGMGAVALNRARAHAQARRPVGPMGVGRGC